MSCMWAPVNGGLLVSLLDWLPSIEKERKEKKKARGLITQFVLTVVLSEPHLLPRLSFFLISYHKEIPRKGHQGKPTASTLRAHTYSQYDDTHHLFLWANPPAAKGSSCLRMLKRIESYTTQWSQYLFIQMETAELVPIKPTTSWHWTNSEHLTECKKLRRILLFSWYN